MYETVYISVICACPFSSHTIRLSLLVHSTYKLHSLSSVCCVRMHVCGPLYFNLKKKETEKEEDISSMCDNIRIRIQNQQNNENTMAISQKRRKIIKMIDTHVMHTNMSDDHLCTCLKIYSRAISTCQECRKCFALSENIKTSWIFMYIYACSVSSSITSLCEI